MRLIVDEMPKDTIDCPFGRVIEMYWNSQVIKRTCKLADGGGCELKDGKCPWLKKLGSDTENFTELYQSFLDDASCVDTMKELMSWLGE